MKLIGVKRAFALAVSAVCFVGCKRETPPPPPALVRPNPPAPTAPPPASNPSVGVAPAPQPAAPSEPIQDRLPNAPEDAALRNPVHHELTTAVHLYLMDHRKMPADFQTLVREKYVKAMPQAPAGKRYALDRKRLQVVLVDGP